MSDKQIYFEGPLFLVGMPRSGTKLIRDLLNQHPIVGIPKIESHFIPFLIRKYGDPPRLNSERDLSSLFDDVRQTSFYWSVQQRGYSMNQELVQFENINSWGDLLGPVLKQFVPKKAKDIIVWGDKTPAYISCMPLLKRAFPEAKFIHIVRDPRDYCLSVKRTWGQSYYRAAERWRSDVKRARDFGFTIPQDYFEVKYEDLIASPEEIMREVCCFLGINFFGNMVELDVPSEPIGDASGSTKVLSDNQRKFTRALTVSQIKRIEEIAYPVLNDLGYAPEQASSFVPLSRLEYVCYFLVDAFRVVRFHVKRKGLYRGIKYVLKIKKMYL